MLVQRNGACGVNIRKYLPGIDFKAPEDKGDPPKAFTETVNEELVLFVLQIPSRMDELQALLSTVHSAVVVDKYEKDQVKIKPMKGAERQLEWKAQAQKCLREFMEQFEKKSLSVDENVDPNVFEPDGLLKAELEELKKSFLVVPDKSKKCFELYGRQEDVQRACQSLDGAIAKIPLRGVPAQSNDQPQTEEGKDHDGVFEKYKALLIDIPEERDEVVLLFHMQTVSKPLGVRSVKILNELARRAVVTFIRPEDGTPCGECACALTCAHMCGEGW